MEGITLTWITNLLKSCPEFGVILAGGWTAPLQRLHDIHIATSFTNNFTITTTNPLQLQQPLGAWISPPSTHRPYRLANGSFFVQHDDEKWYRHLLSDSQRSTRNTYRRCSSTIFQQHALPPPNTIVNASIWGKITIFQFRWVMWLSLFIFTPETPPLKAQWEVRGTLIPSCAFGNPIWLNS